MQESNTWPSTKETSQQGRTTGGNCSLFAPGTLLMTLSKKHERERERERERELSVLMPQGAVYKLFMLCCVNLLVEMFAKLKGNGL